MNYGHWTGCNLQPTDADGKVSPNIPCIVHKMKVNSIYWKQSLPWLHIIRFQKGSAISRYWAYTAALSSSTQTRYSFLVSRAALRKMTSQNYPMGSKMNSDGPQRTPVEPQGQKMRGIGKITAILPIPKIQWKKWITATEPAVTYCKQMQTA